MKRPRTAIDRAVSKQGRKGKRDASFFVMRAGRRDANHNDVRDGARKWGLVVHDTAALARKADLLVWLGGGRYLWAEVKTATGELTADEVTFRDECARLGAPWALVRSAADLIEAVVRTGGQVVKPKSAVATVHEVIGQAARHVAEYRESRVGPRTVWGEPLGDALKRKREAESATMRIRRLATSGTSRPR